MNNVTDSPFLMLPHDLMCKIASKVSVEDAVSLGMTCKQTAAAIFGGQST